MKLAVIAVTTIILLNVLPQINAEVWIPENEFTSYYDLDGVFTVIGAVKNSETYPVIPTISITILDGEQIIIKSFELVKIRPETDLPFKFKFPQVQTSNVILEKPELSYVKIDETNPLQVEVIYDNTLLTHDDGHKSGRIINRGSNTVSNIKVYALIHGEDGKLLDVGQSSQIINNMKPGEVREFIIFPDPSVASAVKYYSCFAIGDETIIPVIVDRKGKQYNFRYDSGVWFAYAKFNEAGNQLIMKTQNSWPLEIYANFEFPRMSNAEKFTVYLNDETIKHIQSIDEFGNWHVAFIMAPHTSGEIKITGFEDGDVTPIESFEVSEKPISENTDNSDSYMYYFLGIIPGGIAFFIIFYRARKKIG